MTARVLLVDDDLSSRFTFAALLEDRGFAVAEASTLAEGRDALLKGAVDVALIDVHLDDELGEEIVPDVLAANPHASIVFMSGDGPPAKSPGHAWIVKGSDTTKSLELVKRVANEAITRRAASR